MTLETITNALLVGGGITVGWWFITAITWFRDRKNGRG